jgi:hypothetical protein
MVRVVLKYVYLAVGTALAMVSAVGAEQNIDEKADPDNDGVDERDEHVVRREQRQQRQRHGEARSPMDAATYRANELVERPIRTVLMLVGYQAFFVGVAACIAYTDAIAAAAGSSAGPVVEMIGARGASILPAWILPLLVPIAVVLGLLFTFVIHQSLKTAGDIRRASL